jgi:CBS domain-containing protein
MLVEEIMVKGNSVRSVKASTPMIEAASLMCLYRISGLPVVDDEMKLIGIIAEKDVLARMLPSLEELMQDGGLVSVDMNEMMGRYKEVMTLKVEDLMTKSVISITPQMHVLRAAAVMARNRFRRIPVTDKGILAGVISLGDVHKAIYQSNIAGVRGS